MQANFNPDDDYQFSTDGPICPYCGCELTPDEGYYYSEDYIEETCSRCDKTYNVSVNIETSWSTTKRESEEK